MWVLVISGTDSSCHTQEGDANAQKALFISKGVNESNIVIVEKETFNPDNL